MNHSKQITFGALLSYFSIVCNIAAGLLYTPWMVRQIGQSQYGLYTLASSLITLLFVDFGLSSATARYVSRYHAEGREEKVNTFLGTVYQLYLMIDAVILTALVVVYFFLDTIYKTLTPAELSQFKIVYIIAACFSVINFPFVTLNGVLTSYELFIQQKLADLLHRIMTIILVVIALLSGMGLYALVMANVVSGLATTVFKLVMIRKHISVRAVFRHIDKGLLKEMLGFSVWITVSSLAQRLVFNITPSILGMVASSSAIAVFGIITTIEGYTFSITNAINGMFMPGISRIVIGGKRKKNLRILLLRVGRFQYALNGLIVAGFFVIGKEFIQLWMGNSYIDAYIGSLLVLIPGLFFNSLQIGHTTVIVQNKVKITALVNVGTGVINVLFSLFLSKRFGVTGASLSIFVAYMFRSIALMVIYDRSLDLDIKEFSKKCFLQFTPVILLTVLLGLLVRRLLPINGWLSLATDGVIVAFVYLGLTILIGLSREEKSKLKTMLRRL